jgi:mRNA interferase RelE/StbE/toxin YoeB
MPYSVIRSKSFDKTIERLWRKNPVLAHAIKEKINQIAEYPEHFKPLRNERKGLRRVHFGSHVLIYRFRDESVELIALDHHDVAYER